VSARADLREEGDLVTFHMAMQLTGPQTGEKTAIDTDTVWRFDAEGKVAEIRPAESEKVERAFRSVGIEPD
jgi:predicted SnoaL-like aldol condensation-catalyzing enzyme